LGGPSSCRGARLPAFPFHYKDFATVADRR
jgi:hypothetical protein